MIPIKVCEINCVALVHPHTNLFNSANLRVDLMLKVEVLEEKYRILMIELLPAYCGLIIVSLGCF